jgi:cephalosporin-C deacetylase-like acetyl esterase
MSVEEVQKGRGIGLMGISKGGDIALTMAAFLPRNKIAATVAINCMANSLVSDVVYKGKKILSGN